MMIVECKRPDVELTKEVLEQALRYDMVLDVKYLALTNGNRTIFCERLEDGSISFWRRHRHICRCWDWSNAGRKI